MKIAITGGSGFIGSKLTKKFTDNGHEVLVLDRNAPCELFPKSTFVKTDLINDLPEDFLFCDAVVHLAGVNIFGRWTKEYKKLILSSRVDTARAMISAISKAGRGPKIFISASAVGYYGDAGDNELSEASPNGTDFLAQVCRDWEQVAKESERVGMRYVSVRTAVVLGQGGGMLSKLLPVFKYGLGGQIASGKQWFSWIHLDDLLNVYEKVLIDESFSGPVNASAPNPVTNQVFTQKLASALHRPAWFYIPAFLIRLILGEFGNVIIMSQKVLPKKLLDNGFKFLYSEIDQALAQTVSKK